MGCIAVFGLQFKSMSTEKLKVIKHLGGITEETLTAIKVVAGFSREDRELRKFIKES